jgi:sulfatase maturation enzyme AslB (radical SAM superfamily)
MKYVYTHDDIDYVVHDLPLEKTCQASDGSYNYKFDKITGEFRRWGKTIDDDPEYSPAGPEILDIEISSGKCSGNCKFCYKGNSVNQDAVNMTFETFKKIIDKLPKTLTQVAFGICDTPITKYYRKKK